MDATELSKLLCETLPAAKVEAKAREFGAMERESKIRLVEFVMALVLTARTAAGGRQADVIRMYRDVTGQDKLHRGGFYARFNGALEKLLYELLSEAMYAADRQPVLLPSAIATVKDWLIVDSTTVKLEDELIDVYPGTGDYAALKVHKTFSIGKHNLVNMHLSSAREHDARHCVVTEELRGHGLLVDLGYASHNFLRDCRKHGVEFVIRLKSGWKVNIDKAVRGEHVASLGGDGVLRLEEALTGQTLRFEDGALDFDVHLTVDGRPFPLRLVAMEVPGQGVCAFLTSLDRERYSPELVCKLYRLRWEIEKDNKVNKSDLCLDELDGRKPCSVHTMLYAALLGTTIVNRIVHDDHRELFASWSERPRGPLHARLVAMALATASFGLAAALVDPKASDTTWLRALAVINGSGRDPNWRRRASVLDTMLGFVAPPARPRRQKSVDPTSRSAAK